MEKKVVKSGIWYTISNFLLKSISFITAPIFVRLLSKSEFGDFNNFISWVNIITIICTLNLHSTIVRAKYDFEENLESYLLSVAVLGTLITSICYGFVMIFMGHFESFFSLKAIYIHIMFLCMLVSPTINLYQAWQRVLYKYKMSVVISAVVTLSGLILSLVLVLSMQSPLTGRILGTQIPMIIIGIILYRIYITKGKKIRFEYWKYALIICLPYLPHLLSLNLLNSLDRVMITKICGSEDNALYSLAYSCGLIAMYFMEAFNNAYAPWICEKIHVKDYNSIRQATKKYIAVYAIPVIALMLLAPEVLLVLGGRSYMEAKYVLVPIILGCVCQLLYTLYANVEQFEKKTIGMAIASASAALLNWGLNYIFIPRFGYIAAAYTTLAGYVYLLFVHYLIVRKLKLHIIYDTKIIFLYLFGITALGIGISFLYSYNLIRFLLAAVYFLLLFIIGWKSRKKIMNYIKL